MGRASTVTTWLQRPDSSRGPNLMAQTACSELGVTTTACCRISSCRMRNVDCRAQAYRRRSNETPRSPELQSSKPDRKNGKRQRRDPLRPATSSRKQAMRPSHPSSTVASWTISATNLTIFLLPREDKTKPLQVGRSKKPVTSSRKSLASGRTRTRTRSARHSRVKRDQQNFQMITANQSLKNRAKLRTPIQRRS